MASPAELEVLLRQPESLRVEKTISRTDTDKFGEAICAFANDLADTGQPGYLFIGARPDGSADGQLRNSILREDRNSTGPLRSPHV
jgi:ATP-dependent DNA helicase RecG